MTVESIKTPKFNVPQGCNERWSLSKNHEARDDVIDLESDTYCCYLWFPNDLVDHTILWVRRKDGQLPTEDEGRALLKLLVNSTLSDIEILKTCYWLDDATGDIHHLANPVEGGCPELCLIDYQTQTRVTQHDHEAI